MVSVSHPGAAFGDYEKWLGSLGAIRGDNELFPLVSTLHQGCSCSHGLKSPGLLSACGHQASFPRAGPDPEPSAEGPAGSSGEGQGRGGRGAQPPSSSTSAAPGPSCLCPPLLGLLSGTPVSVSVCACTQACRPTDIIFSLPSLLSGESHRLSVPAGPWRPLGPASTMTRR